MKLIRFEITLTKKDLFEFMLRYQYSKISTFIGLVCSIGALVFLILSGGKLPGILMILFCVLAMSFTVAVPITVYRKVDDMIKNDPYLIAPKTYVLESKNFSVIQPGKTIKVPWSAVLVARKTSRQLLVYVTKSSAYIWPIKQLGSQYGMIYHTLETHLNNRK